MASRGKPLLTDFVIALCTFVLDHRRVAVWQPAPIEHSYRDHVGIYQALNARDTQAAIAAFGRHIEHVYTWAVGSLAVTPMEKKSG
jgi:DNA-binding GntR family transcriptional regulator